MGKPTSFLLGGIQMKGRIYALEGTEGCGKSTAIKLVKQHLDILNIPSVIIREPGGLEVCEDIRNIIFNPQYSDIDKTTELLLMLSIRNENYQKSIKPYLEKGYIVLCDRYVDSTLVYQGYRYSIAKGKWVEEVMKDLFGFIFPPELSKTFYLQLSDVSVGLERIAKNHRNTNKFDEMDISFHREIQKSYDALYFTDVDGKKIRETIDGDQEPEKVAEKIVERILEDIETEKAIRED